MLSYPLFKKLLFLWADHWVKERETTFHWVGHTRAFLESQLLGMFWNSKLAHIKGLAYQDEDDVLHEIKINQEWNSRVCLRGYVVICCKSKVAYSDEYETTRYKWAVPIVDIYKDLQRYALNNTKIAALLNNFQEHEDGVGVYFENKAIEEVNAPLQEIDTVDKDENTSVSLQSANEVSSSIDVDVIEDSMIMECRENFIKKKDFITYQAYWCSLVELDSLEELSEEIKIKEICLFLNILLSFLSYVFSKSIKNEFIKMDNDFYEDVDFLLGRIEKYDHIKDLNQEQIMKYNVGIAISDVEYYEGQEAENRFNNVLSCLPEEIASNQIAHDYYYLSQVAFKLQKIEKAKELIAKSSDFLDKGQGNNEEIIFFKNYLELPPVSEVVAYFFPEEPKVNAQLSNNDKSIKLV